jgi:hypothetical protein
MSFILFFYLPAFAILRIPAIVRDLR